MRNTMDNLGDTSTDLGEPLEMSDVSLEQKPEFAEMGFMERNMETIKSDAYPVTELELDKQRLKDFKWRADERPASPQAITDQVLHQSDRETYKEIRLPKYWETDHFFNDYMNNLLSTR